MSTMVSARAVRKEYKAVCTAMKKLEKRGNNGPLPKDDELYMRLSVIKNTVECLIWNGLTAPAGSTSS